MRKLLPVLVLLASLFACQDSPQNSDKQKEMTQGSSPANGTTATDQQNYGAGTQASNPKAEQNPSHTDNLTNPSPTTPTPQAGSAPGEKPPDSTQNPTPRKDSAHKPK
jgi:hypothetical protein